VEVEVGVRVNDGRGLIEKEDKGAIVISRKKLSSRYFLHQEELIFIFDHAKHHQVYILYSLAAE